MTTSIAKPSTSLLVMEVALCRWLGASRPGDKLIYHRGFLAVDTDPTASRLLEVERAELARVGKRGLWAAERRLACLVQRRHGPNDYAYVIVARQRPKSVVVPLLRLISAEVA